MRTIALGSRGAGKSFRGGGLAEQTGLGARDRRLDGSDTQLELVQEKERAPNSSLRDLLWAGTEGAVVEA